MKYRHTFILLMLVFLFSPTKKIYSQKKNHQPLTYLLEIISKKHHVFFTYNPLIVKDKTIDIAPFSNLSIDDSISLLIKITQFNIDYLGNKYYVLFLPKKIEPQKQFVTGIVIDEYYQPIHKATVIVNNSKKGTITKKDGTFDLEISPNTGLTFSHIGYKTQKITSKSNFLKVILKSGVKLDEVLIVGSRNKYRKKTNTSFATEIINLKNNEIKNQQLSISELIKSEIPSFNATQQSGSDGADHIIPTTYRGLGPDQTLVLINGKRRHQNSLIYLTGTRGRGNSGTDINTIPTSAIKRIEILKDGASAQYGSDAIAGVINIVLKDNPSDATKTTSSIGFYNANNNTDKNRKKIDGFTLKTDVNYSGSINGKGFINLSAEFLAQDHTFRQGTSIRENYGSAAFTSSNLFLNSEIPLSNSIDMYTNGGYSFKYTKAYAYTRGANSERNVQSIYPNGFNPLITSNISDKSFTIGFKGKLNDWNIDFSNTFGKNYFHYYIKETLNATLLENSSTEFDAGGHSLIQNTTNIDFSKHFLKPFEGFHFATGLENKIENYTIFSGEEASYESYDSNGDIVTNNTSSDLILTYNNAIRPGGSQGFPGYSKENEVDRTRTSFSLYLDAEMDFTKKWLLTSALRYEMYSDFGSSLNYKLATNYKTSPNTNIRLSFSTGFRAPSLAQIYYNLKFTNYVDGIPEESYIIANNNATAQEFGIDKLQEEKALNYGLGFTKKITKNLNFAIDSYYIFIKDRIILTGNFDASNLNNNAESVQFFANGVHTKSLGLDFRLNWKYNFSNSKLLLNFLGNLNKIDITKINNQGLDLDTFFGIREQYFLEASSPKHKLMFNLIYTKGKFSLNNLITKYSALKLIDSQIYKPITDFNNSYEERLDASTDKYDTKFTLDTHLNYQLNKKISFQIGANNVFNTYPTTQGINTDSGGLWDAVQMGTNGAFYYTKTLINF